MNTKSIIRSFSKHDIQQKLPKNRLFYIAPRKYEVWRRFLYTSAFIIVPVYLLGPKYTINTFMSKVRARNEKLEQIQKLDNNQLEPIDFEQISLNRIDLSTEIGTEQLLGGANFLAYYGITGDSKN